MSDLHNDYLAQALRAERAARLDRLGEIPTGELTRLAEQFHQLTISMYEELCLRRAAERGIGQAEATLKKHSGEAS